MGNISREQLLIQNGCVLRAIESVLKAKLTQSQQDIRLNLFKNSTPLQQLMISGCDFDEADIYIATSRRIEIDKNNVEQLLEIIKKQRFTAAGQSLSKMTYEWLPMQSIHLRQISLLKPTILFTHQHAEHIKPICGDRFTSLSDGNHELILEENVKYSCLTFEPRKSP